MDELGELLAWLLWGWWADSIGNSRGSGMGKRGTARGKRPQRTQRDGLSSRVIYCGNCGKTGDHLSVRAVRLCYGRPVSEGPDYGYVRG